LTKVPLSRYLNPKVGSCDYEGPVRLNWSTLLPLWLQPRRLGLRTKGPNFMLEDSTFQIFGGSVHYFRVPKEYWRDRLLKMKACGLNTLTTYVPWNLHEPERGKFDFSGNLDLEAFIQLAAKIGLWVILRPGPYICSEIDLGGLPSLELFAAASFVLLINLPEGNPWTLALILLFFPSPSWLLQDPNMKLRTTYYGFTKAVDLYFDHLMSRVVPLQYKHGGPIIAVQVENEYGSYYKDHAYMPYIKKALEDRGIIEMLLTSDNKDGLQKGVVSGVLATINLQSQQELKALSSVLLSIQHFLGTEKLGNMPAGSVETAYWLQIVQGKMHDPVMKWTWWGLGEVLQTVSAIIKSGSSINLYMFHGGTNFGFINGAMHFNDYKADVTSYGKYLQWFSLFLPSVCMPIQSEDPINMENLPVNNGNGQAFGYVLYETTIFSSGILRGHVHDRGQGYTTLRILVENRGRVNYGNNIDTQRKGLIGNLYLDNNPLKKFRIYSLDMTKRFFERWVPASLARHGQVEFHSQTAPTFPAFFLGALSVGIYPSDTFLKLEGWTKGVVFVNDHNLGRYWNIGPQETLYLPGVWLDKGLNKVIIFEETMAGSVVQSTETPYLGRNQYVN
ncbi:Beta-galactosidase-1-like protein 2, partial [Cricetulus griseus]